PPADMILVDVEPGALEAARKRGLEPRHRAATPARERRLLERAGEEQPRVEGGVRSARGQALVALEVVRAQPRLPAAAAPSQRAEQRAGVEPIVDPDPGGVVGEIERRVVVVVEGEVAARGLEPGVDQAARAAAREAQRAARLAGVEGAAREAEV